MPVLQRFSQSANPVLLALLLSADVVFVLLHLVLGSHHALLRRSDQGAFFGACNYYGYVATKR